MKLTDKEARLSTLLFGGNKGYQWLTSFLGLMHSISHTRKYPMKKELIMT